MKTLLAVAFVVCLVHVSSAALPDWDVVRDTELVKCQADWGTKIEAGALIARESSIRTSSGTAAMKAWAARRNRFIGRRRSDLKKWVLFSENPLRAEETWNRSDEDFESCIHAGSADVETNFDEDFCQYRWIFDYPCKARSCRPRRYAARQEEAARWWKENPSREPVPGKYYLLGPTFMTGFSDNRRQHCPRTHSAYGSFNLDYFVAP